MSFGVWFWIKFFITLPLRLLVFSPYYVIKIFSKERATEYVLKTGKLDDWFFK